MALIKVIKALIIPATVGTCYLISCHYGTIIRKLRKILHIDNEEIKVDSTLDVFLSAFKMHDNRMALITALVFLATVGACYLVSRNNRKPQTLLLIGNTYQEIQVASTLDEFLSAFPRLRRDCEKYRVLGFDCEWVTVNTFRYPVALLQLATYTGYCLLIRLREFQHVPFELRALLEDERIWKVGVVPQDDAKLLAFDYCIKVNSTLDLRHIAKVQSLDAGGLARMANTHLQFVMEKDWRICASDWDSIKLNDTQIRYAATDAHVAIELFKLFTQYSLAYPTAANEQKILKYKCFLEMKFNSK